MALCEGLRTLPGSPRIVVLQRDPIGNTPAASSQTAQEDISPVSLLPWSTSLVPTPLGAPMQTISALRANLFSQLSEKLGARACCFDCIRDGRSFAAMDLPIVASSARRSDLDLVAPYYTPRTLEGLLTTSIIYPLTRCLYGKRIRNPFGPDIGVSRKLAQKILGTYRNAGSSSSRDASVGIACAGRRLR